MRGRAKAMGCAAAAGWLALSLAAGEEKKTDAAAGDAAAGKKSYKTHCSLCHFADASITKVGPGMKDLFKQKKLPLSGLSLTEESVRKRIEDGSPDPQKPLMPAYKDILTPKEMADLLAYLKTL